MENLQKKIQILINLYKSKNLLKAELLNNELIKANPKMVFLYNVLGLILTEQKKINEAIKCYEKGIEIDPKYVMLYNNLGNIYQSKENYNKAENYFKKAILIDGSKAEPQNNLGNLYLKLNQHQIAITYFKKAIGIKPNFFVSHYNLGIVYKNIGKFKEARKYLKKSVKLNPHFFTAHRALSQIIKYKKNDKHFVLLKKLYVDSRINDIEKTELAFALGKASADIKDFENAFQYYEIGNNLRRKNINFSINNEKNIFNDIKKIFNDDLFSKFSKSGLLNMTPIFVLGMPRSGTTLVEQIISSHPKVFGGDELDFLPDLIQKHFSKQSNEIILKDIMNFDTTNIKDIAMEYIGKLKKISRESERVTDKLPVNFKWIGFIKILFPNSKVIHCVRNPKDNCLSIFTNFFVNPKLDFAYNLSELTEYYNLYYDLMIFWKKKFPKFIIDIEYEKLVNSPESEIKSLLKSCNLKWNNKCLKFYNNKRVIKTASDTQARKKIYKGSINSWINYEKYLKDFFQKLH